MDLNKTVSGGRNVRVSLGAFKMKRLQKMWKFLRDGEKADDDKEISVWALVWGV